MANFLVTTPQTGFTGASCGVHFDSGVAVVDDASHGASLRYFRAAGYEVVEVVPEKPAGEVTPSEPAESAPAQPADQEPAVSGEQPTPESKKTPRSRRAANTEGDQS